MCCNLTDGAHDTKQIKSGSGLDFNLWEDKRG
jgi:hypothetical protein